MKKLKDSYLEHIGFVVEDLETTVDYLEKALGIDNFQIYDFEPSICWSEGNEMDDYKLKIAMAKGEGDKPGFEVIEPITTEGIHTKMAKGDQIGINHIAYLVKDYDHWKEHFNTDEYKIIFESETEDEVNGYRRCFYVLNEDEGLIIEIKERAIFRG